MPNAKKLSIVVRPWPPFKPGKLYKGQIKEVVMHKRATALHVNIRNLDPSMLDRLHSVELPLPPRPGNRASRFLSACGQLGQVVGTEIEVDNLIGTVVAMRFIPAGNDYEIEFENPRRATPRRAHPRVPALTILDLIGKDILARQKQYLTSRERVENRSSSRKDTPCESRNLSDSL